MSQSQTETTSTGTASKEPLSEKELALLHAWWRAANYLAAGQIFLLDNPLLQKPLNELDRFHLVMDVVNRVPLLQDKAGHLHQMMHDKLVEHKEYIYQFGEDMPEIVNWQWPQSSEKS